MKITHRSIDRDGSGTVALIPELPEDMYHLYNLLSKTDTIKADTFRRITSETATGSTDSQKVRIKLCIRVTGVHYDVEALALRVKGRVVEENKWVKVCVTSGSCSLYLIIRITPFIRLT